MTTRLYYTDAHLRRFEAVVREAGAGADGRPWVVLDRTAFYPTSGGQPFDTGRLDEAVVVEATDREDATVVHWLDRPLDADRRVTGEIDWGRRFDHMQQHTGQHVLSAAFIRCCDLPTVSFHLGAEACTIDVTGAVDAASAAAAEAAANAVVFDNRPVTVRFVSAEEAARLPLRKEPARTGTLRLIEIPGSDLSACGGTHVARTGAIGLVAVTGWERYKGGTRVSFVCGGRALAHARRLRDVVGESTRPLSILPGELPDAISRLQADQKALRQEVRGLQARLAEFEAAELAASAAPGGIVAAVVPDADAARLKALATAVAARPGLAVLLVSGTRPAQAVVARSQDGSTDAGAVLRGLTSRFGGRGGGRPDLAQGGGFDAEPEEIRAAGEALLRGA